MNYQQLSLFTQDEQISKEIFNLNHKKISLENGYLTFYPNFFDLNISNLLYQQLKEKIAWQQDYIKLYGKENPIPRLTAWYGDEGKSYTYSGIKMDPHPWIEPLLQIKKAIEPISQVVFNSVLLNMYRNGKDSVAWHSDDEPELGKNPVIASVSFGGTRRFLLKPKDKNKPIKEEILLTNGSFLLMAGETQKYWLHQIPKTSKKVDPRINLTFRVIYD